MIKGRILFRTRLLLALFNPDMEARNKIMLDGRIFAG
jgi:hypothetical protein